MSPQPTDPVQQAIDIARLQEQMQNLNGTVTRLAEAVEKLVQAQTGARWVGGLFVYGLPVVSAVLAIIAFLKTGVHS